MPVTYSISTGGTRSGQGTGSSGPALTALVEALINLPDAWPGNLTVFGNVRAVKSDGSAQQLATVSITNNVLALPAVPGSGTTFWNLQINYLTGAAQIQSSAVAQPAALANNIIIASAAIPAGATIPWMQLLTLVEMNN